MKNKEEKKKIQSKRVTTFYQQARQFFGYCARNG